MLGVKGKVIQHEGAGELGRVHVGEYEVVLRSAEDAVIVQLVQGADLVLTESMNAQDGLTVLILQIQMES